MVALQQREGGPCVSGSRVQPRPSLAVSHTWGWGHGRRWMGITAERRCKGLEPRGGWMGGGECMGESRGELRMGRQTHLVYVGVDGQRLKHMAGSRGEEVGGLS